ncbi:MAG TPA: O-antigen ligase family protein, partial [Candidatus Krumholzibacteria bacterium]|nr:O-antigen ligase family protein [Candidatus Krumholzibacteria bacterium]
MSPARLPRLDLALAAAAVLMLAASSASIAITQISLGLGLGLLLVRLVGGGGRPPRLGLEVPALLVLAWALLMIPLSTDVHQSLINAKRFFLFAAVWVAGAVAVDERRRAWLMGALLAGAAGVAAAALVQALLADGSLVSRRMQLTANPMTSGSLMMITSLVALGAFLQRGLARRARALAGAAGLLCLLGLLMTMTRSTWLGFGVGVLVILANVRRRLALGAAGLGLLLALALLLTPRDLLPGVLGRMTLAEVTGGRNTTIRLAMWEGGLRMAADRPLTGFGDRDLRVLGPQYYPNAMQVYHGHLHNDAVMVLAIWGWPGLAFVAWFVGRQGVLVLRRRRALLRHAG